MTKCHFSAGANEKTMKLGDSHILVFIESCFYFHLTIVQLRQWGTGSITIHLHWGQVFFFFETPFLPKLKDSIPHYETTAKSQAVKVNNINFHQYTLVSLC